MKKIFLITLALLVAVITSGCVRRIVTINSEPQGAEVYLDYKLIGQTPISREFFYYGGHHLELVKEEYVNLKTRLKLKGPIYEYFPFSVFSEVLIPWRITDEHNFTFKLEKGQTKQALISPIEEPQPPLPAIRLERISEKEQ